MLVFALTLAGCGSGSPSDATPVPTAPPTYAPTLQPGATSVGNLLTAMDAAWNNAASMRTTYWETDAGLAATPPPAASLTIEEVVRPSSRHVVQVVNGVVIDEQIVVDGRIFMKGSLVPTTIAPMVDTNTWVEVDPAAATSNSPIAGLVNYLAAPVSSPVGTVSDDTRARVAIPSGLEEIGGRQCNLFTFPGDSALDYELAIDPIGLPCRLVISAGVQATVTMYEFNVPGLTITAPSAATPPAT